MTQTTSEKQFAVSRVFDAPRDLVWKAMTEPERLMKWWGPKGFENVVCEVDLRPGGKFRYAMRSPDGHLGWGQWIFQEILAPERMITVVSFTDEAGNILRHPMSETWPLEMQVGATLQEESGKTRLSITSRPYNATAAEIATFEAGMEGMDEGFNGTFDKLEAYLAEVQA